MKVEGEVCTESDIKIVKMMNEDANLTSKSVYAFVAWIATIVSYGMLLVMCEGMLTEFVNFFCCLSSHVCAMGVDA